MLRDRSGRKIHGETWPFRRLHKVGCQWADNPIGIGGPRTFAGTVRVWLPESDILRCYPIFANLGCVIADFGIGRIAEKALVDKREVRHIQKVLDGAWPAGIKFIGAAMDLAEVCIIPLWEGRNIVSGIARRDPDPVVALTSLIDLCACPGRGLLFWMSREADALSLFIVGPAVIGAAQRLILHFSE